MNHTRYSGELTFTVKRDRRGKFEVMVKSPGVEPLAVTVEPPGPSSASLLDEGQQADRAVSRALDFLAQRAPELSQRAEGSADGSGWIVVREPGAVQTSENGVSRTEWRIVGPRGAAMAARVQTRSGKLVVAIIGGGTMAGWSKVEHLTPSEHSARNVGTHRRAVVHVMREQKRGWSEIERVEWGSSRGSWPDPPDELPAARRFYAPTGRHATRANSSCGAAVAAGAERALPNARLDAARKHFMQEVLPHVPRRDYPAAAEAWARYLDGLRRERIITALQFDSWTFDEPAVRKAIGLTASRANGRKAAEPRAVDAKVLSSRQRREGVHNYRTAVVRLVENGKTSILNLELDAHWNIKSLPDDLSAAARSEVIQEVSAKSKRAR